MSTGVIAPPTELHEDWWDGEPVYSTSDNEPRRQSGGNADVSRRSAVTVLEDALDLAVEAGLDWQKREAIDTLISRAFQGIEISQTEISTLLDQWEVETSRYGSVAAAKHSYAYQELLRMDSASVIRAALKRLADGPSPHLLMLLEETAGAAPASSETTVAGAAEVWLDWGRRQGLV